MAASAAHGDRPARCSSASSRASRRFPADFHLHPKLKNLIEKRKRVLQAARRWIGPLAETLAFGSLVLEGTPVRLSGQDSGRGHVQPAASGISTTTKTGALTFRCSIWRRIRRGSMCTTAR